MGEQIDSGAALKLAAQLRANADAHQEPDGTERRRAADQIESLVAELDLLCSECSPMAAEPSGLEINAINLESRIGTVVG